jgi:hypothetical protein
VSTRIAPSAALEAAIEELLAEGLGDGERLAEIGRLGARLVLQRAMEEEVTAFLGRARYERTAEARGSRNGNRPRQVQTAEGELEVQVPQVRGAAERFVSGVIPNGCARNAGELPSLPGVVDSLCLMGSPMTCATRIMAMLPMMVYGPPAYRLAVAGASENVPTTTTPRPLATPPTAAAPCRPQLPPDSYGISFGSVKPTPKRTMPMMQKAGARHHACFVREGATMLPTASATMTPIVHCAARPGRGVSKEGSLLGTASDMSAEPSCALMAIAVSATTRFGGSG